MRAAGACSAAIPITSGGSSRDRFDGSASTDADGTIATYEWFLQGTDGEQALGSGVTLSATIPDGTNIVRLQVTDDAGGVASDTVQVSIAAPPERTVLSELPNLTPNQQKMATQLDRICTQLDQAVGMVPAVN